MNKYNKNTIDTTDNMTHIKLTIDLKEKKINATSYKNLNDA